MGMKSLAITAVVATGMALASAAAWAAPITGGIATIPAFGAHWQATGGATFNTYTGIQFATSGDTYVGVTGNMIVSDASGDLAGYLGLSGTIHYLVADLPGSSFSTISDFYKVSLGDGTTLHFDLESIASNNGSANGFISANAFALKGTGEFYITDSSGNVTLAGPTAASWHLQGSVDGTTFSWNSTTTAAVPEPASIALLGAGLAGLGMRRKKRAA